VSDFCEQQVSVLLHDYSGTVDTETFTSQLNKNQQTDLCEPLFNTTTTGTQTTPDVSSKITQTVTLEPRKKTANIGIQCTLPDISFLDIKSKDSKVMLYTGLPNAGTFCALFDEMGDMEEQAKTSDTGKKLGRPRILAPVDEFLLVSTDGFD